MQFMSSYCISQALKMIPWQQVFRTGTSTVRMTIDMKKCITNQHRCEHMNVIACIKCYNERNWFGVFRGQGAFQPTKPTPGINQLCFLPAFDDILHFGLLWQMLPELRRYIQHISLSPDTINNDDVSRIFSL